MPQFCFAEVGEWISSILKNGSPNLTIYQAMDVEATDKAPLFILSITICTLGREGLADQDSYHENDKCNLAFIMIFSIDTRNMF